MNILVVTTKCPWPLNEGRALRTYNLLLQASKHHRITLCTFVQCQEEIDGLDEMREFCESVWSVPLYMFAPRLSLVADVFRELFQSAPLHAVKYAKKKMRNMVRALIQKNDYDVLHLDMLHLSEMLKIAPDVPTVLVQHNVESQILERRRASERKFFTRHYLNYQYKKLRRYEAASCETADHVVTVSDDDRALLKSLGVTTPITSVPNAVDTDYFSPSDDLTATNTLIYVGSLAWFPNEDAVRYFMAEIMPLLKTSVPDVTLTVIGRVDDDRMIAQWRGDKSIRFAGFVDDIRPHVEAAAVYVVPLRVGGGTRLKILDAMAMGKALVTTSIGCEGLGLVDEEQGRIVDSPEDFARAVVSLFEDRDEIRRMGARGREYVCSNFQWQQVATSMNGAYETAAGTQERPGPELS